METIIATTDLSANSKAGMRYAIQLAQKRKAALVFVHVHYIIRATTWPDNTYTAFVREEQEPIREEFSRFVQQIYKSIKLQPANMRMELINDFNAVDAIIAFAQKVKASYLCISTHGAGGLRKLFGTNTSSLIGKSPIPVICIPSNYRSRPVGTLLYASDMRDYEKELQKVVAFAKPLNAKVELLHVAYPWELVLDKELAEQSLEKKMDYPIHLHYRNRDSGQALLEQISDGIKTTKPDLLVMFTNQERSFFERVFLSSKAKEYSFQAKVPLLCFKKAAATGL